MKKALIICVSFSLAIVACKKKEPTAFSISKGLKDYFNWQKGTYWVYKDSISGNLDSLVVNSFLDYEDNVTTDYTTELIEIGMNEYNNQDSIYRSWTMKIHSDHGTNYSDLEIINYDKTYYNFTVDFPFNTDNSSSVQRSILSAMNINGIPYADIYRYRYVYNGNQADEIFTNSNSGIIKINLNNTHITQILELERAHIVH